MKTTSAKASVFGPRRKTGPQGSRNADRRATRSVNGLLNSNKEGVKGVFNRSEYGASPAGVNQGQLVRQNNRWRESYNPLRGLVMQKVVAMLEAGERGEFTELQWLYRYVEKRFPVLRALIMRRRSALVKLDWDVKIISELPQVAKADGTTENDPAMEELAKRQRDYLKGRYELIRNLKEAIKALALAEFRGFAVLNKHRYEGGPNDGAVKELHWLPQWNFARDGLFGDFYWNENAVSGATAASLGEKNRIRSEDPSPQPSPEGEGAYLRAEDFLIREVDMPINEIGAVAFLRSNLSQKDWDAFIEIFGLSGCVVIMPPNIPNGKEEEYRTSAERIAEGASGALPSGGDAKFPAASVRSNAPFKEHLEWQEKDVVLAGTGGKLTMLTGPTGLGGGQAEVHQDVFDEVATAEAGEISEVFQCQFDRLELEREFPGQPVLAYFVLEPVDRTADETKKFNREVFKQFLSDGTVNDVLANQTDLKQLTEDVGVPVNEEYVDPYLPVADQSGNLVTGEVLEDSEGDVIGALPQASGAPEDDDEPVPPSTGKAGSLPVANRASPGPSSRLEASAQQEFAQALAEDLRSVRERIAELSQIQDDQVLRQRAGEMVGELERLKADITKLPKSAQALAQAQVAALFSGLTQEGKR